MIPRLFHTIETVQISVETWIVAFVCIGFVRTFLETFANRPGTATITSDFLTIIHYLLFYLAGALVFMVIIHHFARVTVEVSARIVLFGFLIILTPPLTDLLLSHGLGEQTMAYLFGSLSTMLERYLTFFGPVVLPGISIGIRVEVVAIMALMGMYVFLKTRSTARSVISVFLTYTTLFMLLSFPAFIGVDTDITWLIEVERSLFGQHFFHPEHTFTTLVRAYEMYFNGVASCTFFIIVIVAGGYVASRWNRVKVRAILMNSRPERILYYMVALGIGVTLAHRDGATISHFTSWLDWVNIVLLVIAYITAWLFAVGVNDIVDYESDKISNPRRPLVTGTLTIEEMRSANLVFLLLSLTAGYLAGQYALFMVVAFTTLYYMYSVPPLHLKRFALVNPFIIALATLSAVYAGFYTVSIDQSLATFPREWITIILVCFTFIANVKDIKDVDGDRAVGVYTLPVIFGAEQGKHIIGGLVAMALVLFAYIMGISILIYLTIPVACIAYYLIVRATFRESHLFVLYFFYIALVIFLLL